MSVRLSNISLRAMRRYLQYYGCECTGSKGGHEKWVKQGLRRPIILQSHIDPVPERIVKQCLQILGISRKQLEADLENF